jgi:hypothetical protein
VGTLAGSIAFSSRSESSSGHRAISIPVISTLVILIGSSVLLFARLGHYSLWTDEASTAITAAGVWRTGDTSAWLDEHNLLTYRDGLLLNHQKDRYTSPLAFYVAAPFIGLLGHSAFACRLPFALCGLGTVIVALLWLRKSNPPNTVWLAAVIVLVTNASFFLFARQCRYYELATFLATLVAYLYCTWNGSRRKLMGIALAMSLLLASQYLDYAAVAGCLLIDYGIWGRRRRAIRRVNWLILVVPQLVMMAIVCPIWNPIARAANVVAGNSVATHKIATATSQDWLHGFLTLIWWNIRDMIASDFAILPLLVLCPVLYFRRKNAWLLRAPVALLVFVIAIAFFTAHPMPAVGNAEIRYLAPVLPLCIGISILAVWGLGITTSNSPTPVLRYAQEPGCATNKPVSSECLRTCVGLKSGVCLALMAFWIFGFQPSTLRYYNELLHPMTEPYTPVAQWVNQNIPAGSTAYVCPDMCVSPMMWDAPGPTYVWQLSDPPKPDYAQLPAIYFKGRIPPDYLIAFGPDLAEIQDWQTIFARQGVNYEPAATIPVYYNERFRPEIIWRSFTTIEPKAGEEIYIFRKK